MMKEKLKNVYNVVFPISFAFILVVFVCLLSRISSASEQTQKPIPEVELGRKIFAQIKPHLVFTKNPLIMHTVEKIGKRVLGNLPQSQYEFRFFTIKASDINAFALPNGYIFVTNRLIQTCDDEDELAFVLCHEIAHVLRGHFMNFISQKKKMDMTTLAIIALGAIVAQDKDLQGGLPALGLGINQNLTLSYSRGQEYEADTYGLRYLEESGFNGEGASKFMNKLRLLSQITISLPVYLSTHPMPIDRLVNIKRLEKSSSSNTSQPSTNNFTRLKLLCRLETELSDRLLAEFHPIHLSDPYNIDTIYSLALIYEKLGSSEEAEKYYKQGLRLTPKDGDLLRDYGIFLYRRDQMKDAETKLRLAGKLNPEDLLAHHYLGRVLMDQKNLQEAIKAFLKSKEIYPNFPDNYHFLGILYSQLGDEIRSHKSFEKYFMIIGNQQAAQFHSLKWKQSESVIKEKKLSSK